MLSSATKNGTYYNEDTIITNTIVRNDTFHEHAPHEIKIIIFANGHGEGIEGKELSSYICKKSDTWVQDLVKYPLIQWTIQQWTEEASTFTFSLHNFYRTICSVHTDKFDGMKRFIDKEGTVRKYNGEPVYTGSTLSISLTFPIETSFRTITIQVGDSLIYMDQVCVSENTSPTSKEEWTRLQSIPSSRRLIPVYDTIDGVKRIFLKDGTMDPTYYIQDKKPIPWNFHYGLRYKNLRHDPVTYFHSPNGAMDTIRVSNTRVIGDYYGHPCGLSHEPIVKVHDTDICPFIIIGNHSVWDLLNSNNEWVSARETIHIDLRECKKYELSISNVLVNKLHQLYKDTFHDGNTISIAVLYP
jgi:hypothetical protein